MNNLLFATKDVIGTFYWTNSHDDRWTKKQETVNGRIVEIHVNECASTYVGVLYRILDQSINQFKYILHVGVEHQNEGDVYFDEDASYEAAMENALINPFMTLDLGYERPGVDFENNFLDMIDAVHRLTPKKFVLTDEEIQMFQTHFDPYGKKYPNDWKYFRLYNRNWDTEAA